MKQLLIPVFSPDLCELLQIPVVEWSGPNVLLAVGKRDNVEGTVETDILIENLKIHVTGLVFGINGYQLMLGNNSLRQLKNISINYEEKQALFELGNIDCDLVPKLSNFIFCKASYQIPPKSIIYVKIGGVTEMEESVSLHKIEPSPKLMNDKRIFQWKILLF